MYPIQSQHLSTVYESLSDSPSSRLDIECADKNTMENKALETVLIDVAEHSTENCRTKSNNVSLS